MYENTQWNQWQGQPAPNYGFNNPYLARLQQDVPAPKELIRINGNEGARAFQIPPNSTVAMFDSNDDIMYIKSSDAAGLCSIRKFAFTEIVDPPPVPQADLVTRQELNGLIEELKGMIANVQQPVQKQNSRPAAGGK